MSEKARRNRPMSPHTVAVLRALEAGTTYGFDVPSRGERVPSKSPKGEPPPRPRPRVDLKSSEISALHPSQLASKEAEVDI